MLSPRGNGLQEEEAIMKRPDRPQVTGALAPYAEGFRKELSRKGYSPWTAPEHMYLMSGLSRWLDGRDLSPAQLSSARIEEFLIHRRSCTKARWITPRAIAALLGYLRGLGVVPAPAAAVPASPAERLLAGFAAYLATERGLCPGTIAAYRHRAGLFLSTCAPEPAAEGCGLERLEPRQINEFLLAECAHRSIGSTKNMVIALRVLMRFLYLEGYTAASLAGTVPRAIPWRDSGRSRALEPGQVSRLLASCDRRNPAGRRDFAILTTLARLGLRAGEVASLKLDDLDWRAGEITVCGKGGRKDRLPLPVDVGEAITSYCRRGRPRNEHRALFLQVQAPYGPLASHAVTCVVQAACRRAGMDPVGAHRLRHSAATAMRRAGAPLVEVGQVLRHGLLASSALYAKEDLPALASIAREWPGARP
jgi:site-specific recombinase XerD